MKTSTKLFNSLLSLLIMMASCSAVMAQDKQATQMKEILDSKNFVFLAQSVTPSRGGFRQLTSRYELKVSGDSLICDLPYFGRAYTAPIDPSSGGFNFTSISYDYTITARKKKGWDVSIKPKDYRDVQQLFLNVFSNGTATLQVTSNSRQPILFNGVVTALKL